MKRDVEEGRARCLVRLGRHTEALEIAADLVSAFVCFFRMVDYFLKTKQNKTQLASSQICGFG